MDDNLAMDWRTQIEHMTKKYVSTVNLTLSEKGLLLDQKIRVINAIVNASIAYRTRLMGTTDINWMERLINVLLKN